MGIVATVRSTVAALALLPVLALSPVHADQTAPELDRLFDELAVAEAPGHAARLESKIWQAWLEPPDDASGVLMGDLETSMRAGELNRALEIGDELVESYPTYAEAWNKRATVRYLLADFDGSVADIQRTVALEPRHFGAISGLGLIFLQQGDPVAALRAFEQVLELSPASSNARASVERVRVQLDKREI